MSTDKAVQALRSYVADYSSEDGMFDTKHYVREFQRILDSLDSKPAIEQAEPTHTAVPLSAIRPIAVEAIRAVTGCPDLKGNGLYLVDELESVAKAAAKTFAAKQATQPARVPLSPDALADKCEAWLHAGGAGNIVDAYEAGFRGGERAHGIVGEAK